MALLDVGRVCRKVRGKDAGEYCVVVDTPEKKSVLVDGKGIKRKKVSIFHVEPTAMVIKIKKNAPTKDVVDAMSKADLP